MGKKRSREENKDVPAIDAGADRMDEDMSDGEEVGVSCRA